MAGLRQSRSMGLGEAMVPYRQAFIAERVDQAAVADCIRRVKAESGYLLDPHSACAVVAARKTLTEQTTHVPHIALATAHPAKFPDTIEAITGARPALPPRLASLMSDPERITVLPNDLGAVERWVEGRARARQGAAA
jgi:threonine synthase